MKVVPNEFDKSLKIPKYAFRICGLDLGKPRKGLRQYIRNTWFFYFNLTFLYTDIIGEFLWIFRKFQVGITFNQVTFSAPCVTMCFLGTIKIFFVFKNENSIVTLLNRLKELHPDTSRREFDTVSRHKLNKIVENAMRLLNIVTHVLSYANVSLYVMFVCSPAVVSAFIYVSSGKVTVLYPLLVSYPYTNSSSLKVWPIAYIHQAWSGVIALLYIVASDTLLYSFCIFIHIQFKVLSFRIESVIRNTNKRFTGSYEATSIIDIVKYHQELIDLVLRVDQIYSKSTLFNFLTSSILICLSGFNLTLTQDTMNVCMFFVFLVTSLSQIFILCYFGDMIQRSSIEVCDSLTNADWDIASQSVKKIIIFMLCRSQKGCKLTAFKFADINIRAFTKVLSTSWSYFALLKTIYSVNK